MIYLRSVLIFVIILTLFPMASLFAAVTSGEEKVNQKQSPCHECNHEQHNHSHGSWPCPCGVACLNFALKHFGKEAATPEFNATAGENPGLEVINQTCRNAGLHTQQVQMSVQELQQFTISHVSVRMIVALKNGHFGYVQAAHDGEICFLTLAGKSNWCPAEKLESCWTGSVLVISQNSLLKMSVVENVDSDSSLSIQEVGKHKKKWPLRVVFFHSPSCYECHKVKNYLPQVVRRWKEKITIELRSVDDINVFDELFKYEKHYGATVSAPPAIFVGDKALVGDKTIIKDINTAIENALAEDKATFQPAVAVAGQVSQANSQVVPNEIKRRFESFGPGAVAIAGLIDGVNPCAFTTIVFFLSMLAYLKKTRKEMVMVGASFTVGMFVAYFLLGLGLLGAVKTFSVSHGLSSGLACGVGILAFALAGWSFIDAIRYIRSNDTKQVTLGLPDKVKSRVHKIIRTGLTTRGLVLSSLSVGFFVSILESLCTGQVYLPTIVFMTRAEGMRSAAVGYLVLYNVMFILPLVGILVMTYFGVRSETLANLLRRRLAAAKFAMSALFACLGILVMLTL